MAAGDTATVFLETTLGTRFVVSFPAGATTVADLKDRVSAEHAACFPRTGPIAVTSLQVKLDGSWFQLTDSMAVRAAFEWVKGPWRLLAEAHELRSHPLARKDAKCGTSDAEPSAGWPVISDNSTQMQYLMPPAGSQGGGSLASGDGVSDTPQINQQDKPQEGDEHTSGQGKDGTTMPLISSDLDLAAGDSDTLLPNQDKPQECVDHASGQIEDGIGMPQESSDIDLATGHSGTPLANQEDKPQECVEHDSGQLEDGITMPQESSDIDLSTGDSGTPLANLGDKPQECVEHASDQLKDGIIMPQKSSDFDLAAGDSDAPPMNQQDKSQDAADHASVQSEDKPTMHQESSDLGAAAGRGNGPVGDQQKDIITEARGKKRFRGEDKTNESIIANCGDDLSPFASSTCNAESSEKRSCVTEHAKLNSVPMPYDLEDHSHGLGENLSGGQKETSTSGVHNVESRNSESNIPPGVESMERGKSSDREVKTKRGDEEPQIAGCGGESSCKRTDDPHCVEPMKEDVKRPVSNSHYLDKGKNEGATSNVSIDRVYFRRRHKRIVVPKVPISKAIKIHPFSQWGHDFHPDYRGLGCLKQNFPRVPIMALTATPTESVRKEVLGSLRIPNAVVLKRSFDRLNLNYEVIGKTKTAQKQLGDLLKERFMNKSGIVYCLSKIECADTAEFLREKYKIKCAHYHASLAARQRTSVQEKWHSGEVKVICAPIAFGTGIDKPDVRFVIHNTMSKSIESYYQESGRAGRDDLPAHCIVLYQKIDFSRILCMLRNTDNFNRESFRVAMEQAKKMQSYCKLKTECRRQALLEHFGEQYSRQRCRDGPSPCDNCLKTQL